ncbi:PAS domain-containing hybrid sensor histidine kinase/response regulator [Desulfovibrio sp. TomC]|uniref:PAS domain-containing hybrid sensor histidine kinase/response regulator n=1 Tax=Desulfovibrio sp. TomC TaxID=1562888 RepID=UPI0005749A68|nr:PAS domain-containing hybrid sensor histidine kinase/response regulator [Desulfovibrio sp. TomC]KHK03625.1 Circadian input kinase A [Desulfovibrio sp. TomC]
MARLTSIIAALDQAIAFIAPSGIIAEINDRYLAWLGLSRADVLGRPLEALDLETEDYQATAFLNLFRRGVAHSPVSFESRVGERDVTVKLQPVIEDDVFAGLIVSLIDVTPLVEARLGVEREKRFLEQVITIAGAAICIVNRDDVVVTINDEFTAITGYTRDQALGRARPELLRESPPSPCPASTRDATVQKRQSHILTRSGRRVTILKNAAPLLDADGRSTGGIESFVDVSDLIRAQVEAEDASRMKSAFLANMSHEIRTPLNAIMGLSQLLLAASLAPEQRECVETMRSAGEGLLVILNDILDFSRIEVGRLEIRPAPLDIDRLLEEVRRVMAQAADEQGLTLTIERDPALPRVLVCDPVRLKQILLNLLSNAIKFTSRGRVVLSVARTPPRSRDDTRSWTKFCVRDTGPGIPEHMREQIFEPFVQTEDATARNPGGTGLGLSISNRLTSLLGGTGLEVASVPGQGSTFFFTLPLAEPEAAATRPAELPLPPAADFGGLRALVAEDNPFNRFLLQKILEKLGVGHTDFASDGNEALALALTARPPYHIIFMDLRMPGLGGLEVTRHIRQAGFDTPIVALTAQAAEEDAARCREAGMTAYFSKPYRINDLEAVLTELACGKSTRGVP